jgi:hypothetical protein
MIITLLLRCQICLHEPYLVRRHFIKNMSLPTIEYSKLSTGWWSTLPAVVHKKEEKNQAGRKALGIIPWTKHLIEFSHKESM